MGPQPLEIVGEHVVGAEQTLHAHRRGDVGHRDQVVQVVQREDEHAEHPVGAVDQRQALLLGQHHRGDARGRERLGRRAEHAVAITDGSLAHHGQRAVRERSKITGAAETAVLVDDRGDAAR